jgi:hypothetical protein
MVSKKRYINKIKKIPLLIVEPKELKDLKKNGEKRNMKQKQNKKNKKMSKKRNVK